jgi:hypothetical protein
MNGSRGSDKGLETHNREELGGRFRREEGKGEDLAEEEQVERCQGEGKGEDGRSSSHDEGGLGKNDGRWRDAKTLLRFGGG